MLLAALELATGCTETTPPSPAGQGSAASRPASSTLTTGAASAAASSGRGTDTAASPAAPGTEPPAPSSGACSADMELVEGQYCPVIRHECLEHHPEYVREQKRLERRKAEGLPVGRSNVAERCLRYREPSTCISKKTRPMRFCMDRFEWPNRQGEIPQVLTSWTEAAAACRDRGKRLCTAQEFNFACEGEQLRPYVYGYERDSSKCSIDRPYLRASTRFVKYRRCLEDPECKAELDEVDQRVASGTMAGCASVFGVHDLNGNVDEWVRRVDQEAPSRSGLKGGWWGPLRCRCRPMTTFHKENDYGYGIGFRCCQDADPPAPEPGG